MNYYIQNKGHKVILFFCICRDLNKTFIDENGIKVLSTYPSHRYTVWVTSLFAFCILVIPYEFYMGLVLNHNDVIKRIHFPSTGLFVRGIHHSLVDSPHIGQWRGALMFLWPAPQQTVKQIIETPVISDAIAFILTSLQWYQQVPG